MCVEFFLIKTSDNGNIFSTNECVFLHPTGREYIWFSQEHYAVPLNGTFLINNVNIARK